MIGGGRTQRREESSDWSRNRDDTGRSKMRVIRKKKSGREILTVHDGHLKSEGQYCTTKLGRDICIDCS